METNFTPGPWERAKNKSRGGSGKVRGLSISRVVDSNGVVVAFMYPRRRQVANLHLISAAPEMYEALAEAVEKYGKPGGPWNVPGEPGSWIAKAKAALKKARGELMEVAE